MAYDPKDPRNANNRLHLPFGNNERFNNADSGRAYPTTPSTFPQPVFTGQNGQQEVWGAQQQPTNTYPGGPPSYFTQTVNLQPQFQQSSTQAQNQNLMPGASGYPRTPGTGGYNDGTNGLAHQFAHQNLGTGPNTPRSASPYSNRQPSPAPGRPRTGGQDGQQQQQQQHAQQQQQQQQSSGTYAPAMPSTQTLATGSEPELPAKHPEKYGDNIYRKSRVSVEFVSDFFKESVQRAKERNQRAVELRGVLEHDDRLSEREKAARKTNLRKGEAQYLRFLRTKCSAEDYTTLKVIGKGAFGEVKLVTQKKDSSKIYALKSLIKSEMYKRDQLAHVRAERDVLAQSDSPWVVTLHTTFQDKTFLYMLMEYLPGGDMMTMLIKYEIFSEDITRFYMAELVLAIEAVHKLGFIHRDIKPDNILLDRGGHIKLTDFGLSTGFHKQHDQAYYQQLMHGKAQRSNRDNRNSVTLDQIQLTVSNRNQINTWRKSRRQLAFSTVGTPDYIAPEIFTGKGYDFSCDWWSVGTIMFECLIGWPPFCAEESTETYRKIVDWPRHLHFPPDQKLTPVAEDFVRGLINDANNRLGSVGGATEIKQHGFFRGVDWTALRRISAPFKPKLSSAIDTQYFPVDEIPQHDNTAAIRARDAAESAAGGDAGQAELDYPWLNYTFKRFDSMRPRG